MSGLSTFHRALIFTAIPIVALSLLSTGGAVSEGLYALWFVAAAPVAIAFVVLLGFAIAGKGDVAAGMMAGIAVGILAMAVTCFANLSTVGFPGP